VVVRLKVTVMVAIGVVVVDVLTTEAKAALQQASLAQHPTIVKPLR
jgi:hypothetical protein